MSVSSEIRASLAPVVDLVYPPRCPLCGEGMAAQSGVCADCWSALIIPGDPCCASCQRPFGNDELSRDAICAPCLAQPPRHDGIAAATLYNEASRKLVLAFKHGGRIALAPMLAKLISARVPRRDGPYLVVPVPLHRWRLWRRGYNQSALLADSIAQNVGGQLAVDALLRTKNTPLLGGMGKAARKKALTGAITVASKRTASVKGRNILLVDDVMTSGATSAACVSVLKKAGATSVTIACFARVLDEAIADARNSGDGGVKYETPEAETPGAA